LHEKTFVTYVRAQWVKGLHVVELVCLDMRLAKRRHPKIHKGMLQARAAGAAITVALIGL
jgi:hypothetical protein